MLRSIGKQSGESGESVLRKKEGCGGKDLQKKSFTRGNKGVAWRKRYCKEQYHVHAGEEGHTRSGWTTSRLSGLSAEESIRMTEDKWRKYVHGVANPRIEDGKRTEQNRRF